MPRVRCPQKLCIYWLDGWCDADEIELDAETLACITFEEMDETVLAAPVEDLALDLDWDDAADLFADELDERLYEADLDMELDLDQEDDDEEEDEDNFLVLEDDDWGF